MGCGSSFTRFPKRGRSADEFPTTVLQVFRPGCVERSGYETNDGNCRLVYGSIRLREVLLTAFMWSLCASTVAICSSTAQWPIERFQNILVVSVLPR